MLAGILSLSSALSASGHAPLPKTLLSAKSAYIDGQVSSRIRDKAYEQLAKWGRFRVVDEAAKADVIVVISSAPSPSGVYSVSLSVVDPSTNAVLWSDQKPWKGFHASEDGAGVSGVEAMIRDLHRRIDDQERGGH